MCTRSFSDRLSQDSTRSSDRLIVRRWVTMIVAGAALWAAPALLFGQSDSAAPGTKRVFLGRILGVFDQSTGEPIEGVEVYDMLSKSSALTTSTGTVALSFVDSGGSIIRLRKVGYEAALLTVTNRSGDLPITTVMTRTGVLLPTVTTKTSRLRGAADTVRKLALNGFYDRRDHSGAAPMAFVMGEKIQNIMTFDDFQSYTGRPMCVDNLYVDGIRVNNVEMGPTGPNGRRIPLRNLKKHMVDQILDPRSILAIENYRVSETPIEYNITKPAGSPNSCGATLIWTK
jgi:hypothetical protein